MPKPDVRLTRRDFLKVFIQLLTATAAGSAYSVFFEPSWVEVTQISLKLRRLPAAFSGFRLLQIADMHFGGWMTLERFRPALELIHAQKPDAIVIPGDFIHGTWDSAFHVLEDVKGAFRTLTEQYPTFAVLGNHDHGIDADMVRRFLKDTDIRELRNDLWPLKKAGAQLTLCGVDDIWAKQNDLTGIVAKLSAQDCAILLAHEPDFADVSAATGKFDLQLSGHSHGGQVVLPFMKKPPLLPYLGEKYHTGLYQVGEMLQYTTRGLGMVNPTVRFNCRPEITVLTLESA